MHTHSRLSSYDVLVLLSPVDMVAEMFYITHLTVQLYLVKYRPSEIL